MKKIIAIVLTLALGMGMSGCGNDKPKRTHHIEKTNPNDDVPMP